MNKPHILLISIAATAVLAGTMAAAHHLRQRRAGKRVQRKMDKAFQQMEKDLGIDDLN